MRLKIETRKVKNHNVVCVMYSDGKWLSIRELSETKEAKKNGLTKYSIMERIRRRGKEIKYLDGLLCNRFEFTNRIYETISNTQYKKYKNGLQT